MTRFLLDTGIAGDYRNHRHGVFERARAEVARGNPIGIGVPVLAELAAGIENSQSRDRNMKTLKAALATLKTWPFDQAAAFEYGRIFAELVRIGRPMQAIDMIWSPPSPTRLETAWSSPRIRISTQSQD